MDKVIIISETLLQTLIRGCSEAGEYRRQDAGYAKDNGTAEEVAEHKRDAQEYEDAAGGALALLRATN